MSHRFLVILSALMLCTASTGTENLTPKGVWLHNNGRIKVEISPCGERLCGRIVWLKFPYDDTGEPRTDSKNPDADLRDRPVLGLRVLHGLRRSGPNSWSDGWIYNPDDGNTYRARVTVQDGSTLLVRAFVALPLFGETLTWTRTRGLDEQAPANRFGMLE